MPGQPGSENRRRQIVRSTRWDVAEFALLQQIATVSGCSEAEVLRRLVMRASKQILISSQLVAMVGKLGGDMNKIASRLNAENGVDPTEGSALKVR